MPKIELEILRRVETTRDESVVVEVNVPKSVVDDLDDLHDWVKTQLDSGISPLTHAVRAEGWTTNDEDETVEIDEVNNLSE